MSNHSAINEKRIERVLQRVIKAINKEHLTVGELILLYGNLGYHLGASIAGLTKTGPHIEELQKVYYANPTIDVALMLNGLTVTSWYDSWIQKPTLSAYSKVNPDSNHSTDKVTSTSSDQPPESNQHSR